MFDNSVKIARFISTSSTKWCLETIGGTESGKAVTDKRYEISNMFAKIPFGSIPTGLFFKSFAYILGLE